MGSARKPTNMPATNGSIGGHVDRQPAPTRVGRRTLRSRFLVLAAAFSVALILLLVLAYIGFQALSGARAYVHGESQWAKAQKNAVISLYSYSTTGNPSDFDAHLAALEVTLGDRRAREALDRADPDLAAAREGFLAGRNHPDDVATMIRLFAWARDLPLFDQAVEAWERGDTLIEELAAKAQELRQSVEQYGPSTPPVRAVMSEIVDLDARLTAVENEFSMLIGRLSHQITTIFSLVCIAVAILLLLGGNLLTRRLVRNAEAADKALRESENRYRALINQTEVGMWQLDRHGRIEYLNPAMRALLGLARNSRVQGLLMETFVAPEHRERVRINRLAREGGHFTSSELKLVPRKGEPRQVLVHGAPVILEDGKLQGHVGTCVDITDRKTIEEKLRHQAFHDPLTGLPNRHLFMDRLQMAMRRARRDKLAVAVLFVDLDRFKLVNDSMGHIQGDQLLREAASRLGQNIRDRDTISRFGGDEFAIILEQVDGARDAEMVANRVVKDLAREFRIDNVVARIGASVGIALSTEPEDRPADILRYADIAMYVAKRAGGGTWHIYDPEKDSMKERRLHLESQLWDAAGRNELVVHYQPIVDLHTRKIEALEALVRWNHPERGLLPPADFIEVAEESGAIEQIGHWVAGQVCRDMVSLRHQLGSEAPKSISVNISEVEFRLGDPSNWVSEILKKAGLPAEALGFEVTEGLLTRNPGAIQALEQLGCPVAIDDFGTGFSSLSMLRQVRFSKIKIDRSFISALPNSNVDIALIESIIRLGFRLDMQVVAEGIENAEQLEVLLEMGCELGQGFYFSKPLPLETLLQSW